MKKKGSQWENNPVQKWTSDLSKCFYEIRNNDEHKKSCSKSLVIKKIQIKSTTRYGFTWLTMVQNMMTLSTGTNVGQLECQLCWWEGKKKSATLEDPWATSYRMTQESPRLDLHWGETKTYPHKWPCVNVYNILIIIAQNWRSSFMGEWINKCWCMRRT